MMTLPSNLLLVGGPLLSCVASPPPLASFPLHRHHLRKRRGRGRGRGPILERRRRRPPKGGEPQSTTAERERERLQWRTTLLWGEGRGGRGVKGGSGGGGGEGSLSCAVLLLLYVRTHSVPHSPSLRGRRSPTRPPRKDGAPFSSPPLPPTLLLLSLSNPTRPKSLRRRG